jgi:hypothetical protein
MYNISNQNNTVVITNGERTWAFPKGALIVHANAGDNQSVDLKLKASRKLIISFRYDQCNIQGNDAQEVAEEIGKLI